MSEKISASKELAKLLKEDGDFRDNFEKYLWEVFVESKDLYGSNLYRIYYDLRKQEFTRYEFINSSEWIPNDDLMSIIDMSRGTWDNLYDEYNALKEYWEDDSGEIAYSFEEWVDDEVKSDYIENTIDLIIERLEW